MFKEVFSSILDFLLVVNVTEEVLLSFVNLDGLDLNKFVLQFCKTEKSTFFKFSYFSC